MLTALKLLFSGPSGWITILGFIALLGGVYAVGHANGHTSGYASGVTDGKNSRNGEVSHLNDNVKALSQLIDTERKATSEKIKTVEASAASDAIKTQKVLGQQIRQRDTIIQNYKDTVSKDIQTKCALSLETVKAINLLIDNANEDPDEKPSESTADPSTVPASPAAGDSSAVRDAKPTNTN